MIGLVLVTHGRLAEELRSAMEHVVGPQRAVATVCIGPDDDMERRRQDIRESIASVEQGDGVVVLTDILGGTPCNLAVSLADRAHVDVIAGVNLPLLVKLAKIRGTERLAEAVDHAAAAGRKYIAATSDMPVVPSTRVNGMPLRRPGGGAAAGAEAPPRANGAEGGDGASARSNGTEVEPAARANGTGRAAACGCGAETEGKPR
jgi:mannose PTS system EIIA component